MDWQATVIFAITADLSTTKSILNMAGYLLQCVMSSPHFRVCIWVRALWLRLLG